jgi:type I restriction enzyme S subunit
MTIARRAYVVRWKDSPRWDIKTAKATLFRLTHADFRPLANFAEEATAMVRPMDAPDKVWPVYGVNNTEGVFLSQHQRGEKFNTPYKRIRKDWFFHNPTRANVGSLGRVPHVPDDAITSPEYQVWRLRGGLLPEFVEVLIKTRFFIDLIDYHRVGAVKERLFVGNLLEIPIPDLPERQQRSIVLTWEQAQAEIANTRRRIAEVEDKIEADFLADLGLTKPKRATLPKVFAIGWKDLDRWSVMFTQLASVSVDISTGKYPMVTLGDVAAVSYGIQKCPANRPGQYARPYLRVANVQRGELDLREVKTINVPDAEMPNFRLEPGDLLVCEGNSADLVGRPAMWRGEIPDCVHQNHILKVRVDRKQALPEYVLAYMQVTPARIHFRSRAKFTTNLASINSNDLRELPVVLPPLPIQHQIVAKVTAQRQRTAALKAEADRKAQLAKTHVEAMLLGEKAVAA